MLIMKKLTSGLRDLCKFLYKAKPFFATSLSHRKSVDSGEISWLKPSLSALFNKSKTGITASSTLQCQFFRVAQMWQVANKWFNGDHHQESVMGRSEVSLKSGNKNLLSVARKMSLTV